MLCDRTRRRLESDREVQSTFDKDYFSPRPPASRSLSLSLSPSLSLSHLHSDTRSRYALILFHALQKLNNQTLSNRTKEEKPTLAGVNIKTRKRNIAVALDPGAFVDAVAGIFEVRMKTIRRSLGSSTDVYCE